MNLAAKAALFVMQGQTAERAVAKVDDVVPNEVLLLSPEFDLSALTPTRVRRALDAALPYKLFFVFEDYLRELIVEVLSKENENWWDKVPPDVQQEVARLEQTEEDKSWMALGSRDKSALMTLPQLLKVIEHNWKNEFDELLRDRALIQEARTIGHLRNTICHMTTVSQEEIERIKQTMRDWFRVVAP
jgi:hypothetical protein